MNDRLELLVLAVISIGGWWLCEFYNAPRFWNSDWELWWHYHNLEPNPYLRRVGYDWAFATIFPLQFLTAELFRLTIFKGFSKGRVVKLNSRPPMIVWVVLGVVGTLWPLIFPSVWLAPVIWLSFILLLDPINRMARLALDHRRPGARRLAKIVLAPSGRRCLRVPLGVFQLLGASEMDLHRPLLWRCQNLRNAGAWVSGLPAICNRVLGDVHLCAFAAQSGRAYGRKQ